MAKKRDPGAKRTTSKKTSEPSAAAKGGRPSILTKDIVADVVDRIEKGAFPLTAARTCGISQATFYRWLKEGASPTGDPSKREFREAIEKARGRLATKFFETVRSAAIGYEVLARDAKGNPIPTKWDSEGRPIDFLMEKVPGDWHAASRALESLTPDEFLRVSGGSPATGASAEGTDEGSADAPFEIIYIDSNRDPREQQEIDRVVAEKVGR